MSRRDQRKFNSKRFKIAPKTALQSSIVVLCRLPFRQRLQVCIAIFFKRYANTKVGKE